MGLVGAPKAGGLSVYTKLVVANATSNALSFFDLAGNWQSTTAQTGLSGPAGIIQVGQQLVVSNYTGSTLSFFALDGSNPTAGPDGSAHLSGPFFLCGIV
jgi:DNA-binding beta-propeller fold protein YncE